MLEKCRREQWKVQDLDWDQRPRSMSRDDEIAIVQYYTDMAGIERLAGALFDEQRKKVDDPVLVKIFSTFVADEKRHAEAAEHLAAFYDVHHYKEYEQNPALVKFTPHFVNLIQHLAPEVANSYITAGELILDIALLRSLNEYVGDGMSQAAMDRINRDESRHIAIDYHMVRYYSSADYQRKRRARPRKPPLQQIKAWWALAMVLWHGRPFFRGVFFEPMKRVDPSGKRLREAFKRIQLLGAKESVKNAPIIRNFIVAQELYNDSLVFRVVFGRMIERLIGLDREHIMRLYSEDEAREVQNMSFDEMAQEALAAKGTA
jgi:hypothetical protein